MQVNEVLDFDDIFGYWHLAWLRLDNYWLWAVGLVAFLVLVYIFYFLLFKRKKVSHLTPKECLVGRINGVYAQVIGSGDENYKQFYVESLAAIKEYAVACKVVTRDGCTDDEFLVELKTCSVFSLLSRTLYPLAQRFVEHGFSVKFAAEQCRRELIEADYNEIINQINQVVGE